MRSGVLFFLLLTGCDDPGQDYRGVTGQRVTVGQSTFTVYVEGSKAQAVRTNPEWAPRPETVMPRAMVAFEKVSGCRVKRMKGDQVVIEASLDCGGDPPSRPQPLEYDCDIRVLYRGHAEVVCEPGI